MTLSAKYLSNIKYFKYTAPTGVDIMGTTLKELVDTYNSYIRIYNLNLPLATSAIAKIH
jgi:hypothetical protein